MDRQRHQADSRARYFLYFNLLHQKMEEHKIKPGNIYNMDEKGLWLELLIYQEGYSGEECERRMGLLQASKMAHASRSPC
jgi:hypothetical protein